MDLPTRIERKLGPDKDQWCHYHRTYGHETENCRILIREIERLVQDGHLGRYVKKATDGTYRIASRGRRQSQGKDEANNSAPRSDHVIPAKGDLNTIRGGFAGGRPTNSFRKRYARSVMSIAMEERTFPDHSPLFITTDNFEGVYPHEDDPMVISVVSTDYRVKRVLIDQGSSADIIYLDAFEKLGVDRDLVQPFTGTLVGFSGEQIEIRGYI